MQTALLLVVKVSHLKTLLFLNTVIMLMLQWFINILKLVAGFQKQIIVG